MKEQISAFMDGELDDQSAGRTLDTLEREREALESWRIYHLISDALRDGRVLSEGFTRRVAEQLAKEPTVWAPNPPPAKRVHQQPRRSYALAASLAAVALVGWLGFAPRETAVAPVAKAPQVVPSPVEVKPVVVPLPRGTNDYLLAHQGFSPRVSLQGMAPYVRTVSEHTQEPRK